MAPLFTGLRLGFGRSAEVAVAPVSGLTATGGVISDYPSGGYVYRAHVFTSTGTFAVTAPGGYGDTVEIFAIGGGGGGSGGFPGYGPGRGGGAGGAFVATSYPVSLTTYPVAVGAGGGGAKTGPVSTPFATGRGSSGGNSTFTNPTPQVLTAAGGGGGGDYDAPSAVAPVSSGGPGGCGGGGGGYPGAPAPNIAGGTATQPSQNPSVSNLTNYGFAGGTGDNTTAGGGGAGGGTGGVGDNYSAPASTLRSGGPGIPITYAYGPSSPVTYGAGGPTGGPNTGPTVDATYSTGNGGMGWLTNPTPSQGGNGGSGIVVVRYQIASLTATAKATGGAISFFSGKTIHTFTSSGTFANPTALTVDYLIVGAGGGGGYNLAGGGGGGLVHYKTGVYLPASPYPVSVGAGGAGDATPGATATTGGSSIFNSVTASGGGGGGSRPSSAGASGGSGGGASIDGAQSASTGTGDPSPSPGTANQVSPANGWGNDGGGQTSSGGAAKGGGGGGAGGVGQTGTAPPYAPGTVGLGGPGLEYTFTGSPVFYGGGGGGGSTGGPSNTAQNNQYGGFGFPNNAGSPTPYPGTSGGNGYENLGGGGGGGPNEPPYGGGSGGSGIVIIAYPS